MIDLKKYKLDTYLNMYRLLLALSWWIALLLLGALQIFIYPLTFDACPLKCTVIPAGNKCVLVSQSTSPHYGNSISCSKLGQIFPCYAYNTTIVYRDRDYKDYFTNVTLSKFGAQFYTAMDRSIIYQIFGWGIGIALPTIYTIVLIGMIWIIRQPYLKQRFFDDNSISEEDRELI